MIVCPITKPADSKTLLAEFDAWLPAGEYIDFFTGTHYRGGRRMKLYRNMDSIPVLVRAGGMIPMAEDYSTSHLKNPEKMELQIFCGADGSFKLYEDADDKSAVTTFDFRWGKHCVLTAKTAGDSGVIPANRQYTLRFRGLEKPVSVSAENWHYDDQKKELVVSVPGESFSLELELAEATIVAPDRQAAIYQILHKAQMAYDLKTGIYNAVCQGVDTARILGDLYQMQLDSNLMGAMVEQLICDK